jgi:cation transport ATPase
VLSLVLLRARRRRPTWQGHNFYRGAWNQFKARSSNMDTLVALGVPMAAVGFMSPVRCAAGMRLSDLVVIGNALRLCHWRQKKLTKRSQSWLARRRLDRRRQRIVFESGRP